MSLQGFADGDGGYGTETSSTNGSTDEQPPGDLGPMQESLPVLNDEDYNLLLSELRIETPNLEEPNYNEIWNGRMLRNMELMSRISPSVAKQVVSTKDKVSIISKSPETMAAICIQKHYRGHLGRKIYTMRLYEQFEKDETKRHIKQLEQVEEGELLVENHTLETEIEECLFARRNHLKHKNYCATIIQSCWRRYKQNIQCKEEETKPNSDIDLIIF